ncbi:MAG: ice-binding family protein [Actinomycetota bacterium]|nr:ice-binding family protein [Actinomycetota bacterium]
MSLIAFVMAAASLLIVEDTANAAIVPTVPLGTSAAFSVLGAQTVTNTGDTVLAGSVGVSPGPDVVGFPPGIVQPPGTIEETTPVAASAQADSTAAYLNAQGRPINATTTNDLSGLTLVGGVFEAPSQGPLSLTGTLTLDGEGDPNSVFIFQTDSTLITGSGSVVALINGAQECNVFWQVGSSATLGSGSTFVGNILALTTISLQANVTVHGRALAQTGEVTLIDDTFTQPLCDLSAPTTTTAAGGATTTAAGGTGTTGPLTELPTTGSSTGLSLLVAVIVLVLGAGALRLGRASKQ